MVRTGSAEGMATSTMNEPVWAPARAGASAAMFDHLGAERTHRVGTHIESHLVLPHEVFGLMAQDQAVSIAPVRHLLFTPGEARPRSQAARVEPLTPVPPFYASLYPCLVGLTTKEASCRTTPPIDSD